jgi:hypothetical protein
MSTAKAKEVEVVAAAGVEAVVATEEEEAAAAVVVEVEVAAGVQAAALVPNRRGRPARCGTRPRSC